MRLTHRTALAVGSAALLLGAATACGDDAIEDPAPGDETVETPSEDMTEEMDDEMPDEEMTDEEMPDEMTDMTDN